MTFFLSHSPGHLTLTNKQHLPGAGLWLQGRPGAGGMWGRSTCWKCFAQGGLEALLPCSSSPAILALARLNNGLEV